jgi:hypothetical protein
MELSQSWEANSFLATEGIPQHFMEPEGTVTRKEVLWRTFLWYNRLHRKQHLQQFFVGMGMCLLSHCLAMIGGFTDSQTLLWYDMGSRENNVSNNSSLFPVCVAVGICIPSHCLATTGGYTYTLMGEIYEVCHWDGLRCHDIHTKFYKDWFMHS